MKHLLCAFFCAFFCASLGTGWLTLAGPARADDAPAYTPDKTTIAILPVVLKEDAAADSKDPKADPLKDRHSLKAKVELALLFSSHGFKVADDDTVQKAVTDQKIDLTDEENQRRAVFYQVGKAVNANLVVFVVIESVSRHNKSNSFLGSQKEGKALLKLWLVDADQEKPILNAVQHEGKAASNAFMDNNVIADTNGYSKFTIRAVGHGIDDILKDFFKPYPELKKPDNK